MVEVGSIGPGSDKKPIEIIISMLSQIQSRPTISGVKNLAKSIGFDVFDDEISGGSRISLSGKIILIDIDLVDPYSVPQRVSLSFANMALSEDDQELSEKMLLENLKSKDLSDFQFNLERLVEQDKMSSEGVDLLSIITEIYIDLQKVYQAEKFYLSPILQGHGLSSKSNSSRIGVELKYFKSINSYNNTQKIYSLLISTELNETPNKYKPLSQSANWLDQPYIKGREIVWAHNPIVISSQSLQPFLALELQDSISLSYVDDFLLDKAVITPKHTNKSQNSTDDKIHPDTNYTREIKDSNGSNHHLQISISSLKETYDMQKLYISHLCDLLPILQILRKYICFNELLESLKTNIVSNTLEVDYNVNMLSKLLEEKYISHDITVNCFTKMGKQLIILCNILYRENSLVLELAICDGGTFKVKMLKINNVSNSSNDLKESISTVIDLTHDLGILIIYILQKTGLLQKDDSDMY